MNMKRYIALVAAFAAACLLHAATNTWTGAVNDWNWNEGGNYENGLPSAGDVVKIPAGPTARILGTDSTSLGVINSLERIIPISSNSVMEVVTDADHPVTLNIPVAWPVSKESDPESGYGEVVKIGAGTLSLANTGPFAYCTSFTVREGALRLPTGSSGVPYPYTRLSVSNNATLFTVGNRGYTFVRELLGSGLVTNDSSQECYLQIWGGTPEAPVRVEAKLTPNVRYYQYGGVVDVLSTNNTMTATFSARRLSSTTYCMTGLAKFGNSGAVGSPGTATALCFMESGGGFRYLGHGEKTTKGLFYANNGSVGYGELDGGPYGGLDIAGSLYSRFDIRKLLLSGANAEPCIISGPITISTASPTNFITITKRGTGTWRLAHNSQRAGLAGVSVEEGTLQVESIMEKGEWCSLGPATNCYPAGYAGAPGNEVDYSLALGAEGAGGVPLFELVGTNGAWSANRSIVLFGDARIRNSATNAANEALPMRLSGFSAGSTGKKTLYLEGERTEVEDSVGGISNGEGVVAVVKTGEGTWSLIGANSFTGGLFVAGGTLQVVSSSGPYTWYRWNIKQLKNGGAQTRAMEFGLYDADGKRVNGNLSLCPLYSAIRKGEAAVHRQMTDYYGAGVSMRELYNLFDDSDSYWDFFTPTGRGTIIPQVANPETWYRVLMRLPEGAKTVTSYDVVSNNGSYSPVVWSLEASVDGMTWDEVDRVDANPFSSSGWAFARPATYSNGSGATHTGGHAIAGATNKTEQAISRYCPVSVASGATLKCVGTAEIANLSVDFTGAGTISGFNFATDGTIEVLNVPKGGGDIPLTFADTDPAEVAKIAGWKLSSDGKFKLSASGGLLRILPYGTLFLVR